MKRKSCTGESSLGSKRWWRWDGWERYNPCWTGDTHPELKSMQSLGYKHIVSYLSGEIALPQALDLIKRDTRRYAKRQITWFKGDPEIHWFPSDQNHGSEIRAMVREFFNHC